MKKPLSIKTRLMGKGITVSTTEIDPDSIPYETVVVHRSVHHEFFEIQISNTEKDARATHKEFVERWKKTPRKLVRELVEKLLAKANKGK